MQAEQADARLARSVLSVLSGAAWVTRGVLSEAVGAYDGIPPLARRDFQHGLDPLHESKKDRGLLSAVAAFGPHAAAFGPPRACS